MPKRLLVPRDGSEIGTGLKLDVRDTLDDITNAHPTTIEVFNRFGIDICCGGDARLADAAARDGVDLDTLVRELEAAVTAAERTT